MGKVLVFGYYGFGNFGDELLVAAIKEHLQDHDLTVVSGNPKETEKIHELKAISRKDFWKNPGSYDILLLGGGGLLQSVTSNRSLLYYLAAVRWARAKGLSVYLMAQGLGPFKKGPIYPLVDLGMRSLKGLEISVRDKKSKDLAASFGLEADLVADLALTYTGFPTRKTGEGTKRVIGIAPKAGFDVRQIRWLESFGDETTVRLFAFHKDDHRVCLEVEKLLKDAHTIKMEKTQDLENFADIDFLWGMRLHSLIVAAKMGIPAIGISYDPKVEQFCREVGFAWHSPETMPKEEWIRSGNATELIQRAEKAWALFRSYAETQANRTPGHSH